MAAVKHAPVEFLNKGQARSEVRRLRAVRDYLIAELTVTADRFEQALIDNGTHAAFAAQQVAKARKVAQAMAS